MNSSDLHSVLRGVCKQIQLAYDLAHPLPSSHKDLVTVFQDYMMGGSDLRNDKPLFVFLDSLDQFHGMFYAQ